jgi:hypothetical protein
MGLSTIFLRNRHYPPPARNFAKASLPARASEEIFLGCMQLGDPHLESEGGANLARRTWESGRNRASTCYRPAGTGGMRRQRQRTWAASTPGEGVRGSPQGVTCTAAGKGRCVPPRTALPDLSWPASHTIAVRSDCLVPLHCMTSRQVYLSLTSMATHDLPPRVPPAHACPITHRLCALESHTPKVQVNQTHIDRHRCCRST